MVLAGSILAAACGVGASTINVDSPTLATNVQGAEPDSSAVDDGPERVIAPDFEIDLKPGQDPDDVLAADGADNGSADEDQPDSPEDAILTLCPTVEAVISQTTGDSLADELDILRSGTPSDLHDKLSEIMAEPTRTDIVGTETLDSFLLSACSAPLSSGSIQVAAACGRDVQNECVLATIETLGGLCFDDNGLWLSCVSGLPAVQS